MQNASGLVQKRTTSANCWSVAKNTMGSGNKGISLMKMSSVGPCCSSFAFANTCKRGSPVETVPSSFCRFACLLMAELQRAKRASEAPWVRKIGNPSSRENLVMTSAYDRPSKRASECPYRLGGGGGASRDIPNSHPFGN